MNILFVSSQFPNCAEPNRGVFSLQIVKELAAFADVQVIAPVPSLGPFNFINFIKRYRTDFEIPYCETIDGLKVYHPKYFAMPGMGFTHAFSLFHSLQSLIEDIHSRWHINAVNCHWVFPDGVAIQKICNKLNIPVMLTPLGTDLNSFIEYRLRKKAIVNALVNSDKVSVLCTPMYERCVSLGMDKSKLQIIPNGVDVEKFTVKDRALCRSELTIDQNSKVILFVGSLVPVKGVDTLLKAFAAMTALRPEASIKLYIVGSGYLESDLKRLASELRITNDVVFVGRVPHNELPVWMNAADCLCLPSLSEGHPNVVMEALACGIPVVASAVGAIPDFVTDKTGYLIVPKNHAELAERLTKCLLKAYLKENIRDTVSKMSWKACAEMYYDTLRKFSKGIIT